MKLLRISINPDNYYLTKEVWKDIKKICDGSTRAGRYKTQDFVNQIKKHCEISTNKQLIYNKLERYIGNYDFKTLHFPTKNEYIDDGDIELMRVKDKYSIYLKFVNNSEQWTIDEIRDIQKSIMKIIFRKLNPIYNYSLDCYEEVCCDIINIDENIIKYMLDLSESDMLSEIEDDDPCDAV